MCLALGACQDAEPEGQLADVVQDVPQAAAFATADEVVQLFSALAKQRGLAAWTLRGLPVKASAWDRAEASLRDELAWSSKSFDLREMTRQKWNAVIDAAEARRTSLRLGGLPSPSSHVFVPLKIVVMDSAAYGVFAESDLAGTSTGTLQKWTRPHGLWQLGSGSLIWTEFE